MRFINLPKLIWRFQVNSQKFLLLSKVHKNYLHFSFKNCLEEKQSNEIKDTKIKSKEETSKSFNKNQFKREKTPLQRLLSVKDYADWIFFLFLASGFYIWYQKQKEKKEREKKFEVEWIKIPYFNHKIFTCSGFFLPEFIFKHLNNFKNFRGRKDDIWIVSFPKSGIP